MSLVAIGPWLLGETLSTSMPCGLTMSATHEDLPDKSYECSVYDRVDMTAEEMPSFDSKRIACHSFFVRNVRALSDIPLDKCTSIVRRAPIDWNITSDNNYLFTEPTVDTLERRIMLRGPLDKKSILELAASMIQSLETIHSLDIIHRAINPSTIARRAHD
jgi:hypothetical protein